MTHPPQDPHQPYQPQPGTPDQPGPEFTLDQAMPAGPPPRKSRKVPIILAAVGVFLALTIGGAAWAALRPGPDGKPAGLSAWDLEQVGRSALEKAQKECDADGTSTEVTDGGDTMLIDTKGEEDASGADITAVVCVLEQLNTPQAVIAHMDSTRALDGRQDDKWEGFTASWTYHPDAGMDLILRAA